MYNRKLTKAFLEKIYQKYNKPKSADDPVWNIISFEKDIDKEISAFVAAQYAFGNIQQINKTLQSIFSLLAPNPSDKILDIDFLKYVEKNININHRFLFNNEFIGLLKTLNKIYSYYGGLKKLFLMNYNPYDQNLKNSISKFSIYLREIHKSHSKTPIRKLKFMYPDPNENSVCKRMNLFLRWMVRKDNIDLGLWNEIKTFQLIIPLDTHILKVSRYFGLTKRKSLSWNMAVEITENLKKFDVDDPVKYDFALSHLDIKNL